MYAVLRSRFGFVRTEPMAVLPPPPEYAIVAFDGIAATRAEDIGKLLPHREIRFRLEKIDHRFQVAYYQEIV